MHFTHHYANLFTQALWSTLWTVSAVGKLLR